MVLKNTSQIMWQIFCLRHGQETEDGGWRFESKDNESFIYAFNYFLWLGWLMPDKLNDDGSVQEATSTEKVGEFGVEHQMETANGRLTKFREWLQQAS